jgi:hypothetical protein
LAATKRKNGKLHFYPSNRRKEKNKENQSKT